MSSRQKIKTIHWMAAMALVASTLLGGCSDIYYDRREAISLGANDAVETNKVTHMTDPWPPNSSNRNIAFNGERLEIAMDRYRHNRSIPPVNITASSVAYQQAQQQAASASAGMSQATSATPAAPVKGP